MLETGIKLAFPSGSNFKSNSGSNFKSNLGSNFKSNTGSNFKSTLSLQVCSFAADVFTIPQWIIALWCLESTSHALAAPGNSKSRDLLGLWGENRQR